MLNALGRKLSQEELNEILKDFEDEDRRPERLSRSDGSAFKEISKDHIHVIPVSPHRSISLENGVIAGEPLQAGSVALNGCEMAREEPKNENAVNLRTDDRLAVLEKKIAEQSDEIVLLKSALADTLRRLSTVEEGMKKPKGRMMPSIPTSSGQPSALVRPTRLSASNSPNPRSNDKTDDTDNQTSHLVKGLLKSINRGKSPGRSGTEKSTRGVPPIVYVRATSPTVQSPPAVTSLEIRLQNVDMETKDYKPLERSAPTSPITTTSDKITSTRTREQKQIASAEKDLVSVSPRNIESAMDFSNEKTNGKSSSSEEENPKMAINRPTSTSSRARVSDNSKGLKGKRKVRRSASDLSMRPRSFTWGSQPMSSQHPPSIKKRASTGSSGLKRSISTSSLISKEEPTKSSKDEQTRLYIRGRSLNLCPPSNFVESKFAGYPPEQKLQLEWVYGYRGRDCRNNLFYLSTGEVVYNMAAVVVIYDDKNCVQRHYLGHNDDIKCIALHPNKIYIASGQVAGHDKEEGRPHVRIWDSATLETLQVLGIGDFERAVSCLAFSIQDEGRHLVVVDEANEHAISLWEWEHKRKLTETKGASDPVLMVAFHPRDSSIIVSCGKSHIAFWSSVESGGLVKKMGVFGKFDKPRFVLCICFLTNGDLLSGDSNGNIFVWSQGTNNIGKAVLDAHEGPIFSLCPLEDGKFLSGGRDRLIVLWDTNYHPVMETEIPDSAGPVRCITQGLVQDDGTYHMVVGTTRNSLIQGTLDKGMSFIAKGHTDELWGLAVHATFHLFVTCAYDKQIIMWDGDSHAVIWHKQFEETLQSAAFHPRVSIIAVGTQSGNWMVLDSINGDQLGAFHDGPEQLDAIKYSPDGKFIAVGSHDNFIYLYTVSEDARTYKRHGKLSGHSSFVTHIDWCRDSQYLQSNSGDYEILYWNAERCKQVLSAFSMRDIKWDSWTCVLGFPVCGIWPEGADGTDINACSRSNQSKFLVTGDDFGQVNFFSYPASKLKSDCQNCVGHSSHVTCVRFTYDDTRVISTGGKDCSVMQWKIEHS